MIYKDVKIKDICEFIGGSQPPKSNFIHEPKEGYVRLIQIRDRLNDKFITFIPKSMTTKFCEKSDILIGRYGPPIFQIFRGFEGAYNVAIMKAEPKEGVDKDYLYYFLLQKSVLSYVESMSLRTAGQTGVELDSLYEYPVHIPEKEEDQKRLVKVLKTIDERVDINKKVINKIDSMIGQLFEYWFMQFDFPDENGKPYKSSGGKMVWNEKVQMDIPSIWSADTLSSMIENINTGLNPRDNFVFADKGIKYLTVKNLTEDGSIDYKSCDYINEEARKIVHARSDIQVGDILFASIAPLGRCFLIYEEPTEWDINESVFSIRPNKHTSSSEYLYTYFRSDAFIKRATSNSTGSIFKGIRINTLNDMPAIIPSKEIIDKFSNYTRKWLLMKNKLFEQNEKLMEYRDWLLPMIMLGQITISE